MGIFHITSTHVQNVSNLTSVDVNIKCTSTGPKSTWVRNALHHYGSGLALSRTLSQFCAHVQRFRFRIASTIHTLPFPMQSALLSPPPTIYRGYTKQRSAWRNSRPRNRACHSNIMSDQPPSLQNLPEDVLLHILTYLIHAPDSIASLSRASQRLGTLIRLIRHGGKFALPQTLADAASHPPGISSQFNTTSETLTLTKTSYPGFACIIFHTDVSHYSSYWSFRLARFEGTRIDIGVAPPAAFRFGTVEKASSWSFDCFGRVSLPGRRRTYGRRMRTADVIGVLYDVSDHTLTFLDNGVSMGTIRLGVRRDEKLLPFIYIPYYTGEAVTVMQCRGVVDVKAMKKSSTRWVRPFGLPYDGMVIVHTWEERVWYAIEADCSKMTLARLWSLVQERHGIAANLFQLICNGKRLENRDDQTLKDVGVWIDRRTGSSSADILLSVPHLAS